MEYSFTIFLFHAILELDLQVKPLFLKFFHVATAKTIFQVLTQTYTLITMFSLESRRT